MTKAEIVEQISLDRDIKKKDIAFVIDSFFEIVKDSLAQGETVELRGFGSFGYKIRRARIARNPRSGERVEVDDRVVIVFKPGKELKELAKEVSVEEVRSQIESRSRGSRKS